MRITHLGHACLLVEVGGARILIDPGTFTPDFETVTGLDAVLLTHQHPDHVDAQRLPALLAANETSPAPGRSTSEPTCPRPSCRRGPQLRVRRPATVDFVVGTVH